MDFYAKMKYLGVILKGSDVCSLKLMLKNDYNECQKWSITSAWYIVSYRRDLSLTDIFIQILLPGIGISALIGPLSYHWLSVPAIVAGRKGLWENSKGRMCERIVREGCVRE